MWKEACEECELSDWPLGWDGKGREEKTEGSGAVQRSSVELYHHVCKLPCPPSRQGTVSEHRSPAGLIAFSSIGLQALSFCLAAAGEVPCLEEGAAAGAPPAVLRRAARLQFKGAVESCVP